MAIFTPMEAAIGGATLGVATVSRMALTGRILGHSGIIKGMVRGDWTIWRPVFVGGMMAGSVAAVSLIPGSLIEVPATYTASRAAVAGLLIGLGSALGNGCTSGHGICGLSRLSLRSLAYTGTFMASGAVAASLSGVTEALQISGVATNLTPAMPAPDVMSMGFGILGASALMGAALLMAGQKLKGAANRAIELTTEAATGAMFALGLSFAGMNKSSKVASFLAISDSCWDPTLAFVMCGAILVTLPAFQAIMREKVFASSPPCGPKYEMPTNNVIDKKLVTGGIMFGAGWGIGGMCPGPAICNLAAFPFNPANITFFAAMLAGMYLERLNVVQNAFESKNNAT